MCKWIVICLMCAAASCAVRPICHATGATRCAGNVVERCDGRAWSARVDCGAAYAPGGTPVRMQCVADDVAARCAP